MEQGWEYEKIMGGVEGSSWGDMYHYSNPKLTKKQIQNTWEWETPKEVFDKVTGTYRKKPLIEWNEDGSMKDA